MADIRIIGTMMAVELAADDPGYFSHLRPLLYEFYFEKGVLLRPLGNVVYVLPPYVISEEELHHVHDVIVDSLELVLPHAASGLRRLASLFSEPAKDIASSRPPAARQRRCTESRD